MATEGLMRKRRIQAGHRASAMRTLSKVDDLLAAADIDHSRLVQLKLSMEEKMGTLKQLDSDVLELIVEDDLEDEIQQADEFKDKIFSDLTT